MKAEKSVQRLGFEDDAFPHLESLWRTALWFTMRSNHAEDLVVKTMRLAYRSWNGSPDEVDTKTRLFRVLVRTFSKPGSRRHPPGRFLSEDWNTGAGWDDGCWRNPGVPINRGELAQLIGMSDVLVRGTIARLKTHSRTIIVLRYRERFTLADIAYITDLRKDSVKAILGRLRQRLPRYLLQGTDHLETVADGCGPTILRAASSDDGL